MVTFSTVMSAQADIQRRPPNILAPHTHFPYTLPMRNIILTGFSGAGKSAVGKAAARILGWEFVDTDLQVVKSAGKPIDAIFAQQGEDAFRRMERDAVVQACAGERRVIATGGGAFAQDANRDLMLHSGAVICLEAGPEVIAQRLFSEAAHNGEAEVRPLLDGAASDRLSRIADLKAKRQPAYALAHWTVHTDRLTVDEAAREVVHAWDVLRRKSAGTGQVAASPELAAVVQSSAGPSPIYLDWGILSHLGQRCKEAGLRGSAYLFTDSNVVTQHADKAQSSLEESGYKGHRLIIPAGEASKSLDQAGRCYAWLAERRAERGHFIVALGGGVVGDVAGFVAATYNRGMAFVQTPTSLAAMADAAIGGKTGVDLPAGKNLVGAFHQPRFTLSDVQALTTLPARELTSGWAEVVKHGLILDEALVKTLEQDAAAVASLDRRVATAALRRSVAIKADVVTQDEKETLGLRTLLNYGHTLGHALEAVTGYGALLHGEAVAMGMNAAGIISNRMGLLSDADLARQTRLLERYGLPLRFPASVDVEAVLNATLVDKKSSGGRIRWVLLERIGKAVTRDDVPPDLVREVARELV
jgi:3-dehydroquinate synthase